MSQIPSQQNTGHRARKRFGQNFLVNEYVINEIVRAVSAVSGEQIVEIGPGLGVLTERLVQSEAQVTAIELDRDLVGRLQQRFSDNKKFQLINADALEINFSDLAKNLGSKKLRVVGNLPYNISTPIMFKLLESAEDITDMHFMLQKEVVKRLAAKPGTSAWGRLGIMVQYHCDVEELIEVPPDSFDPPPKVDSAVVRLTPRQTGSKVLSVQMLEKVVRIAFNKRRKTLRNALKELFTEAQIINLDVDPNLRPEKLTLNQYVAFANELSAREAKE